MEKMSDLADWNYHHQFLGPSVGRLTGGAFVGEVIKNFISVAERNSEAKRINLYAGHQRGMLGVEAALGIETARTKGPLFAGRVPSLGSHYAFELHELEKDDFAVRVKFVEPDNEQTISIPGCDSTMCSLKDFVASVSDSVPRHWRQECAKQ